MLHVFRDGRIQAFGHEDKAAEALDDREEVVQLVGQATQQLLVKAVAVLVAKLEVGGENELHGRERKVRSQCTRGGGVARRFLALLGPQAGLLQAPKPA